MTPSPISDFVNSHVAAIRPLAREVNLAYWDAAISGKESDFERCASLQIKLQQIYSNKTEYEQIAAWRSSAKKLEANQQRELDLLHNAYKRNQISASLNAQMTQLASKIENQFNVYRATVDGRSITSNDILSILKKSNDSGLRHKVWQAGKDVGAVVRDDLLRLVKLRNEAAQSLGYGNYYQMALDLGEQKEEDILVLFDELEVQTREPFRRLKQEVDARIGDRLGLRASELRPWHYEDPFFQEAPHIFEVNLDRFYRSQDVVDIAKRFFAGIGLDAADIIARSDLYEKSGKDQHAFCTDIDREGDIRVLTNVKNDETWMGTMLHELGHAVHDKYIDLNLPYLLRCEAHIFTTEAIAMFFGRLSKDAEWIDAMIGIPTKDKRSTTAAANKSLQLQQLIFARWAQVMMRFERALYTDPDQNLDRLWWELVERYQLLTPPDDTAFPHWASKTHIVSVPVYYHNYLLGEVLASQLKHFVVTNVVPKTSDAFVGGKAIGEYLTERVFFPGAKFNWHEMIERATDEPLTPKYFIEEFVR